jgi:hypothetical protein
MGLGGLGLSVRFAVCKVFLFLERNWLIGSFGKNGFEYLWVPLAGLPHPLPNRGIARRQFKALGDGGKIAAKEGVGRWGGV